MLEIWYHCALASDGFSSSLSPAIGKALSSLSTFSHAISEVMLQGVATLHMASQEDGQSMFVGDKATHQVLYMRLKCRFFL